MHRPSAFDLEGDSGLPSRSDSMKRSSAADSLAGSMHYASTHNNNANHHNHHQHQHNNHNVNDGIPFPLVRASWKRVLEIGEADPNLYFGAVFYPNLFNRAPALKTTLFANTNAAQQRMNLTKSLTTVIGLLHDMPAVVKALQALGARHVLYGAMPDHYPVVGSNVIDTLKQILGREWNPALEKEWSEILGVVAKTMIDAQNGPLGDPYRAKLAERQRAQQQHPGGTPISTRPSGSPNFTGGGMPSGQNQLDQNVNDDIQSNDGRASSHGGGSHAGTNSTGSGDGEEEDPMITVIVDVMRRARKAQQEAAARGEEGATPTSPSLNALGGSQGDAGGNFSSPTLTPGTRQSMMQQARYQQLTLFSELDNKSGRGLVVGDIATSQIVFANEGAQRLFGRLDLVGSNLESLMPAEIGERHAGILAAYAERYIQEYRKSGSPPDSRLLDQVPPRRLTVIRKINSRDVEVKVDAWIRTLRMKDEFLENPPRLMAAELCEATQYHEDQEASRIFRSALKNVSDAVIIADFDGRIEWVNTACENLAGYPIGALRATRSTLNIFLENSFHAQHEGFLAHFRQKRKSAMASMSADSHEVVVSSRPVPMKTAFGTEQILLRVEVAYNKVIGFAKSTKEFIPRAEFETERLKLLLPASIVKLLRGADNTDITSHFWEFDRKSVIFTDVVGFSDWARSRPVKAVHDRMQPMFAEFEEIIQSFGGELIHRIGDAVMAIFGFNGEERHHARYALSCAIELQRWALENGMLIRIGLTSGRIGAGIYGSAKGRPGFDAWGPIVNISKRLEALAEPGTINLSKQVIESLGHKFAGGVHAILRTVRAEGIKGVPDQDTFLFPVKSQDGVRAEITEKTAQMVGFQRARFARWARQNEETERRLAELQKASR